MKCTHPECEREVLAKGLCSSHYQKQLCKRKQRFTVITKVFAMDKEIKRFAKENGFIEISKMVKKAGMDYQKVMQQLAGSIRCRLETMQELVSKINPNYEVVIENENPKIIRNTKAVINEFSETKNMSAILFTDIIQTKDNIEEWLTSCEKRLQERGYKKYKQNHKNSDFQYAKTIKVNSKDKLLIMIYFYDWRPYADRFPNSDNSTNRIGIQYGCILDNDSRIDLNVSDDKVTIEIFEEMALAFNESMKPYLNL